MMGARGPELVLAPGLAWIPEAMLLRRTGIVVLDDLLVEGAAADYFRTLRLRAALCPSERREYEDQRHSFLAEYLVASGRDFAGVVFLGSHSTDVDLLDFEQVSAIRFQQRELMRLSREVYGDYMMMVVEYDVMMHAIADSVDRFMDFESWKSVPLGLMREFPDRAQVDLSDGRERLKDFVGMVSAIPTWSAAAAIDASSPMSAQSSAYLGLQYDYLSAIRPEWRTSVIHLLGGAPRIDWVFRLPWFVVIPSEVERMCYRPNMAGVYSASARGESLADYVRGPLRGFFSLSELTGTWVGALLCDHDVAVNALASMSRPAVPKDTTRVDIPGLSGVVTVPDEFVGFYAQVPGVGSASRFVRGTDVMKTSGLIDKTEELVTVPLVAQLLPRISDYASWVDLTQLVRHLEFSGATRSYVAMLLEHAIKLSELGPVLGVIDPLLTPLMPGFGYLGRLPESIRVEAARILGRDPRLRHLFDFASAGGTKLFGGGALAIGCRGDEARKRIYSGCLGSALPPELASGPVSDYGSSVLTDGFCYLDAFESKYHADVLHALKEFPVLSRVMAIEMRHKMSHNVMHDVLVVCNGCQFPELPQEMLVHFVRRDEWLYVPHSEYCASMTLGEFLNYSVGAEERIFVGALLNRGGLDSAGASDVCYSQSWFIAAIISWTIVAIILLGYFLFLLYTRCSGGKSGRRGWR